MEDNSKLISDINVAIDALDKAIKHYDADLGPRQWNGNQTPVPQILFYPHDILRSFRDTIRSVKDKRDEANSTAKVLNFGKENNNG